MGKSIGIDLGTTYSVIGFKDTSVRIIRNNINEELTRSCVAQNDKKDFIVGKLAFDNMPKYIPNVVNSIKRLMGNAIQDDAVKKMKANKEYYPYEITNLSTGTDNAVAVVLRGTEYTPEQISAEILRKLKDDASNKLGEVTHAVITVPAYFSEKQKTATRVAAKLAGLKVKRLLSEPTAAAISYGVNMKEGEGKVLLVYDFGGGTFDLSILVIADNNFAEMATGGNRWLGGDNIDDLIKQHIYREFQKEKRGSIKDLLEAMNARKQGNFLAALRKQIEDAKIQLSAVPSADIQLFSLLENEDGDDIDIEISLTRVQFESLIRPVVAETIRLTDELLETNGYPIDTIDHILLVGGSSCIPLVKTMLADKYGKDKILSSEKPMLAIAEGAALLAHDLPDDFECHKCGAGLDINQTVCPRCGADVGDIVQALSSSSPDAIIINHTTSHNYFVAVLENGKRKLHKIIANAEVLPLNKPESFKTLMDNQKIVKIEIVADAENGTYESPSLGFYTIQDNLPKNSELVFDFYMDLNQTLDVQIYPKGQKEKIEKVRLARGNADEKTLGSMAQMIENVFASDMSDMKKSQFINDVQKQIERINKDLVDAEPDDNAWNDIEWIIRQSEIEANTKELNRELHYFFGKILIEHFSDFIDNTDSAALRAMIQNYEQSKSDLEKTTMSEKLKTFIEEGHFLIFIHIFALKLCANSSNDQQEANRLMTAYNDAMTALKDGNFHKVIAILNNTDIPEMGSVFGDLTTAIAIT